MDTIALMREFYTDLRGWFTWTMDKEKVDLGVEYTTQERKEFLTILFLRVVLLPFLMRKYYIPHGVFDKECVARMLKNFDPQSEDNGDYYSVILQNLFFAVVNHEKQWRAFVEDGGDKNQHRLLHFSERLSVDKQEFLSWFKNVPYLNVSVFEFDSKKDNYEQIIPNCVFFGKEDGKKHYEGLIELILKYDFVISLDDKHKKLKGLDPETIGYVFENLLGEVFTSDDKSDNKRKSTGSFYTPNIIVEFMCDESIKEHLAKELSEHLTRDEIYQLVSDSVYIEKLNNEINDCVDYQRLKLHDLITKTLLKMTVLDPSCGSGAFSVGMLQAIMRVLDTLHSKRRYTHAIRKDYKLWLLRDCIQGVDIQPLALEITKMRLYLSILEDSIDYHPELGDEYKAGLEPFPNLDYRFHCMDFLLEPEQLKTLRDLCKTERDKQLTIEYTNKIGGFKKRYFDIRCSHTKDRLKNYEQVLYEELVERIKNSEDE